MRPYVFRARPKFCLAYKPAMIWVACPKCGHPHEEYFGPPDRDERAAEVAFLQREYQRLAEIAGGRSKRARAGSRETVQRGRQRLGRAACSRASSILPANVPSQRCRSQPPQAKNR